MKNRRVFVLFVVFALMVVAGQAFAQAPIEPCKPRINLKNFPADKRAEVQGLLERTFCEMRDELTGEGLARFPGDRGNDVLKFLDGREKITFVWDENLGKKSKVPVFMEGGRRGLFWGGGRSVFVGPLTFSNSEVKYTVRRRQYLNRKYDIVYPERTFSEVPLENLKFNILYSLTWLTTLGWGWKYDDVPTFVAESYYPLREKVVD